MDAMNFNVMKRGDARESNYRLRGEPVKLTAKIYSSYVVPDGDGWAPAGGVSPTPLVVDAETINKQRIGLRGSRKQRAARAYIPKESIKVVPAGVPAIPEVVGVRLDGGSEQDEKVVELEARIKVLLGLVRAKGPAEPSSITALREKFTSNTPKAKS